MANSLKGNGSLAWLWNPFQPTRDRAPEAYRFTGDTRWWLVPIAFGVAGLIVSGVGWAVDAQQFYFSYLVAWAFCLTLSLGSLFFVLIQHLTKARWSVVVRRVPETLMWTFPLLAVLSIPLLIGMHDLYHWTHADLIDPSSDTYDALIAWKSGYLNVPFFLARFAVYFFIWTLVSHRLYALSVRQDLDPDPSIPARQRKVSAWGLPLFALTTAFSSYDIIMSADPHWFSTIFGVYIFGGSFLSALALMTFLLVLTQRSGGMLKKTVTPEHYQDLGKFMFGFTVFWTYIAFSQYMLIWYGNIPEETIWYRHRLEHGWEYHSAALLIGHFIIPFFALLPRSTKRTLPILSVICGWILVMHWFDLHWLVMPVLDTARGGHAGFHWMDFACWFGLFGLIVGVFLYRFSRHSMVPHNDPGLLQSMRFVNS